MQAEDKQPIEGNLNKSYSTLEENLNKSDVEKSINSFVKDVNFKTQYTNFLNNGVTLLTFPQTIKQVCIFNNSGIDIYLSFDSDVDNNKYHFICKTGKFVIFPPIDCSYITIKYSATLTGLYSPILNAYTEVCCSAGIYTI